MTSIAPSDLLPPEAHDEVRLRVEPTVPPGPTVPHQPTDSHKPTVPQRPTVPQGQTGPGSPGAPQGGRPARADEGDASLAPYGPTTRRTVTADPDVSLGPLGWLAVLLVAALLTVLAHAGSVRAGEEGHREPSLLTDPAYVLAQ